MASDDFLGTGWAFSLETRDDGTPQGVSCDMAGRIAEAGGEEKIRQSIWLILSTVPGERVGRPDFGCAIHDLVFAPRTPATLGRAARAVTEALKRWERRIEVVSCEARPDPSTSSGILLELHYAVRTTNSRRNMVFPFYLQS